jgi:hypothetical protein
MTVGELMQVLQQAHNTFPTAEVRVQGWSANGDLENIVLRGDVRLERDEVGMPVVVLR